jgi:hypothetical protein
VRHRQYHLKVFYSLYITVVMIIYACSRSVVMKPNDVQVPSCSTKGVIRGVRYLEALLRHIIQA